MKEVHHINTGWILFRLPVCH